MLSTRPVGYWRLGEAAASTVSNISVANPTHITTSTPHGILNGATVVISGSTGGVLTINGTNVATVLDATHFTIPVAVTVAGSGGTVNILYAVDEMGANAGTYVGSPTLGAAGLLTGDSNTAVTFDGSPKYVSLGTGASLDATSSVTVMAWIKVASIPASDKDIFSRRGPYDTFGYQAYIEGATGRLGMFVGDGTNYATAAFRPVCDNSIHQVVVIRNGNYIRLSVDGLQIYNAADAASVGSMSAAKPAYIACNSDTTVRLVGTLDEPAIWNRALSAAEVAMLNAIGRGTW